MYLTYLTCTLKLRHTMVDKFCELPVITFFDSDRDEIRDSSCTSYFSTFYRNYIQTNDNDNMKYQSKNHIHVQWIKTRAVTPCSTIYVSFFKLKSFSVTFLYFQIYSCKNWYEKLQGNHVLKTNQYWWKSLFGQHKYDIKLYAIL